MQYVIGLVAGMVLLALGAQGAIRILVDHSNSGLLGWMPGGFAVQLLCYVVLAGAGAALAHWGNSQRNDQAGRSK
ncbi:hypothetical protein AB0L63_01855 [Nocardia sp. NPDC051990]|uniref:hypothetical protein n=1 Tax=Nocardia sp. NPDC051990 TaxID=3155285 RepID=UPI003413A8E2